MNDLVLVTLIVAATATVTILVTRSLENSATERGRMDKLATTNAEADAYWQLFPAIEFRDHHETPIYNQFRHEEDLWFATSVLADIDDLPGGAA